MELRGIKRLKVYAFLGGLVILRRWRRACELREGGRIGGVAAVLSVIVLLIGCSTLRHGTAAILKDECAVGSWPAASSVPVIVTGESRAALEKQEYQFIGVLWLRETAGEERLLSEAAKRGANLVTARRATFPVERWEPIFSTQYVPVVIPATPSSAAQHTLREQRVVTGRKLAGYEDVAALGGELFRKNFP